MENNLPVNLEVKADLTETVNNAYNDLVSPPAKEGGKTLSTVIEFFNNTVLYPMQKYNIYAKDKLERYAKELQDKSNATIPDENLVEPKINILGNTLEALKYNLDEEHIKEMFTNILLANIDNRKQSKIAPSYINVVKELSQQDAMFLKTFKDNNSNGFCSILLQRAKVGAIGTQQLGRFICTSYIKNDNVVTFTSSGLNDIVIDNLTRLNLINVDYMNYYTNQSEIYDSLFRQYSHKIRTSPEYELRYEKGIVSLTEYGKNFIDICLS